MIGRSVDDAALIIHLILQGMYNSSYSRKFVMHTIAIKLRSDVITGSQFDLLSKESRRHWEQQFYVLYIQPVLNDMESRLNKAQDLFIKDDRQGSHFLLYFTCWYTISFY